MLLATTSLGPVATCGSRHKIETKGHGQPKASRTGRALGNATQDDHRHPWLGEPHQGCGTDQQPAGQRT